MQNNMVLPKLSEKEICQKLPYFLIADISILLYNTAKLGFVGWNLEKGFQKSDNNFCLFWNDFLIWFVTNFWIS